MTTALPLFRAANVPPCGVCFFEGQRDSRCVFVMASVLSHFLHQGYKAIVFSDRERINNLFSSCAGPDAVHTEYTSDIVDALLVRQRQKREEFICACEGACTLPGVLSRLIARFAQPASLVVVHAISEDERQQWRHSSFNELVTDAKALGVLHLFRHAVDPRVSAPIPDLVFFGKNTSDAATRWFLARIRNRASILPPSMSLDEFAVLRRQLTQSEGYHFGRYLVCRAQDQSVHEWRQDAAAAV